MIRKNLSALALIAAIPLASCDDATEVSAENFHNAISTYLDHNGEQCLGTEQWPVDVKDGVFGAQDRAKMEALRAVGLVRSEPVEKDFTADVGKAVTRYSLTTAAAPFVKERSIHSHSGTVIQTKDLCWGWMELDKIFSYAGPVDTGNYQEVVVTYTYDMTSVADWAKGSLIQSAFPSVGNLMNAVHQGERTHVVKLTEDGWVAVETK